jgi:hypothetical protein
MAEQNKNQIQVKIDPEIEQGTFANAVSVNVNQNEVVLDFGYILPNSQPTTIKVISRINLTHKTNESLMKVLSDAMKDWKNRQESK